MGTGRTRYKWFITASALAGAGRRGPAAVQPGRLVAPGGDAWRREVLTTMSHEQLWRSSLMEVPEGRALRRFLLSSQLCWLMRGESPASRQVGSPPHWRV